MRAAISQDAKVAFRGFLQAPLSFLDRRANGMASGATGGRDLMRAVLAFLICLALAPAAVARSAPTQEGAGLFAFMGNCFSPFLTAEKADVALDLPKIRYDFYDLDPFSAVPPTQPQKRAATPGTDRRCEVAFDGDGAQTAAQAAVEALRAEGITTPARLPSNYSETSGTTLLAARRLNPRKVAVVHAGTRTGPNGLETFVYVERLTPAASEGL